MDIVRTDTYIGGRLKIQRCDELESYSQKLLQTVLRKHHRNAVTANIFALLLLWASGFFVDQPVLRIPSGASFLILFSVIMGIVGAMKYFLRSWEMLGWVLIFATLSLMVKNDVIDMRSIAYGLNYQTDTTSRPRYEPDKTEYDI